MGFDDGRKVGGGEHMRRSNSLDMLAPPVTGGMGHRRSSYTMLSNFASLVMSTISISGYEHPYSIQAHQNRQTEAGGYAVGESKPPGGVEFYIKRKNPPPPGKSVWGKRERRERGRETRGEGRGGKRENNERAGLGQRVQWCKVSPIYFLHFSISLLRLLACS